MAEDPNWPRASAWIEACTCEHGWPRAQHPRRPQLALLGVPAHLTSLSPTRADRTPAAVRAALARLATFVASEQRDLRELMLVDLGDVTDPDTPAGERETVEAVRLFPEALVLALGGDNSITTAVAHGACADGLITLDAHHDLRDGRSNGSPVRRLLELGMDGRRIVQVGIADFANSPAYAARALEHGLTVISRDELARRGIADAMAQALEIAGSGPAGRVHVDLDVDVCDRAVAPACPASLPGGISAAELRLAARLAARDPRVASMDLTEVDAGADAPDGRTVRLVALCVLEIATGVLLRADVGRTVVR
ncbi:MAG: arginase family protein [Candidatus Nanopelagicales bacterium]